MKIKIPFIVDLLLYKNKKGEILLDIYHTIKVSQTSTHTNSDPASSVRPVNLGMKLLLGLVKLENHSLPISLRLMVLVSWVGLSLGTTLGTLILLNPSPIGAQSATEYQLENRSNILTEKLIFPAKDLSLTGPTQTSSNSQIKSTVEHIKGSDSLGGKETVILWLTDKGLVQQILPVTLGEEIKIKGSNGGWYQYRVVEVKSVAREEWMTLQTQAAGSLLIIAPSNWLETSVVGIIARPV